jgi:nicotinate dehydrogenase subunit B
MRRGPGVVRDGSFLGVIAEREEQAVAAMEALQAAATWEGEADLPVQGSLVDYMLAQPDQPMLVVDGTPVDGPIPPIEAPADAAQTLTATYFRPYQMHGALGPSAAVAHLEDGQLTVWTHAQGVYPPRAAIARVLGMAEEAVRVVHMEGPGCYGHTGADDAALDAALLARALPGRPVAVKWMRADEHTWEPYGPAMVIQMQASLDAAGEVIDWNHDVWGYSHLGRAGSTGEASGLLAAWHLAHPFPRPQPQPGRAPQYSIYRNANPLYTFPRQRIVKHFLANSPLRISALRGLGSFANVFAIESFVDELAVAAGVDPVAFRLGYLTDERARAVVQAAAARLGWQPPVPDRHTAKGAARTWPVRTGVLRRTGRPRPQGDGHGRGLAFARYKNRQCYVAVAVELSVDRASGRIRLERGVIAADAGQVVNPDGLSSQFEGGFLQGASWTLKEQVGFDREGVYTTDWYSYPVLRLPEAPAVETVLLNRPGQPYLGSGEASPMPTGAAIANAVFDAVGIRLRQVPFTPQRVLEALAGVQSGATHLV